MKILQLEDHDVFARMLREMFLQGHTVVHVRTIEAALRMFTEDTFELALVDYDLPDGKGDVFVRDVRERGAAVPIVAMSSHARGNSSLIKAGATVVCAKMDAANLRHVLARLLEEPALDS